MSVSELQFALRQQMDRQFAKQRRHTSLIESIANVIAGIGVAIWMQVLIFPFFGIWISFADTSLIALIFTAASIVRSYILRRLFEHLRVTGALA